MELLVGGKHFLVEVLIAPGAQLGDHPTGSVDEPQVLLGGRLFAKQTGLEVRIAGDGETISVWDQGERLTDQLASQSEGLYVISDDRLNEVTSYKANSQTEVEHEVVRFNVKIGFKEKLVEGSTVQTDPVKESPIPVRRKYSAKEKRDFSRLMHRRMHHGKTEAILKALRHAYPGKYEYVREPCDPCAWARSRMKPVPKMSRRKAEYPGQFIHYDVFYMPWVSEEGYWYLLLLVDGKTGHRYIYGLRKKSEVLKYLEIFLRKMDNSCRRQVQHIEFGSEDEGTFSVVVLRSDGAGENLSHAVKKLAAEAGIRMEASIARMQWQNGQAENGGGRAVKGGEAIRHGGQLPTKTWFKCQAAEVHMRNRLPNSKSAESDNRTPFEQTNNCSVPLAELIDHFRVVGSLCYVTLTPEERHGDKIRAYRAIFMGYSDDNEVGQKGYIVRRLSDGAIKQVTYSQTTSFEDYLLYPKSEEYDAYLQKGGKKNKSKGKGIMNTYKHVAQDMRVGASEVGPGQSHPPISDTDPVIGGGGAVDNNNTKLHNTATDHVDVGIVLDDDELKQSRDDCEKMNDRDKLLKHHEHNTRRTTKDVNDNDDTSKRNKRKQELKHNYVIDFDSENEDEDVCELVDSADDDETDEDNDDADEHDVTNLVRRQEEKKFSSDRNDTCNRGSDELSHSDTCIDLDKSKDSSDASDSEAKPQDDDDVSDASDSETGSQDDAHGGVAGVSERRSKQQKKQADLLYEVTDVTDIARKGKKRGGSLVFEVVWRGGELSWESATDLLPGAGYAMRVFLESMSDRQRSVLTKKALTRLNRRIDRAIAEGERIEGNGRRKKRVKVLAARVKCMHVRMKRQHGVDDAVKSRMHERIYILKQCIKRGKAKIREVEGIKVPNTYKQAQRSDRWPKWRKAAEDEFAAFEKSKAWTLVPRPAGENVVGCRYVFSIKAKNGIIERHKARIVAQGYKHEAGVDYSMFEVYAPCMLMKTFRALLAIAARYSIKPRQYDISCAFLHADLPPGKKHYMEQPEGFKVVGKEDWVYELHKAIYGLKMSPRAFGLHLAGIMRGMGLTQGRADECLWWRRVNGIFLYVLYHVDDLVVVSNCPKTERMLFKSLSEKLDIRDEGILDVFLGMKVTYPEKGGIFLSQEHYIDTMCERFEINAATKKTAVPGVSNLKLGLDDLPDTLEGWEAAAKLPYPALVGCLIFIVKSRWDVAYAISNAARWMSKWGRAHFKYALQILAYLFQTKSKGVYFGQGTEKMELVCYADANWGDARDSGTGDKYRSQGGYLVFMGGSLISWKSKRHASIALSSMEAEYMEASNAGKEIVWMRTLMEDLGYLQQRPTVLFEDNKACISFSQNNTCHDRSKHIQIRAFWCRDLVLSGVMELWHCGTDDMLADLLTKHPLTHVFLDLRDRIFSGNIKPTESRMALSVQLVKDEDEKEVESQFPMMIGDVMCY
jgi:hypothetical protein